MSSTALNPLVDKIRSTHPGTYDDMDDATLTKRVLAKYPQYSDLAAPGVPPPAQPESSTSDSILGALSPREVPQSRHAGASQIEMPGFEGMNAAGDEGKAAAMTGYGITAGTSLGGAALLPGVAGFMGRHPILSSMAIGEARHIPYVGKFIPPYSEMLPLLMGKGSIAKNEAEGGAAIERDATRGNEPFAGEEIPDTPAKSTPIYRDATRSNVPYAGETIEGSPSSPSSHNAAQQKILNRGQYEAPASALRPPRQLGPGVIEGEYIDTPRPRPIGQLKHGAYQRPGGFEPNQPALPAYRGIQLPEQMPKSPISRYSAESGEVSTGTPNQRTPQLSTPISRSRADLMEDKGIQESMQNDLEAHGRIGHDEQVRDAAQYRIKPIREARREAAGRGRATIQQTPSTQGSPDEDLAESWSKAVEDLKAKRGKQ